MGKKIRLDQLLVERHLVPSREKAQALIIAGDVLVNEQKSQKPGAAVVVDAAIRLLGNRCPYVSRGGLKLAGALDDFQVNPCGWQAIDIGASTGGFTDCLLQRGAAQVIALDVGHNQLDWKIRSNPRVLVIEKTNFRYLTLGQLLELTRLSALTLRLAVIDVSFISLEKIFPPLFAILTETAKVIALVKPQFEAERGAVGKGGIVRDAAVHEAVRQKTRGYAEQSGFQILGETVSPITGTDGNKEFFLYLTK
ncbi:rRNA methylase YqxC [Candidatus Termititenax persephonae]|uniref:rRNA methylase YqxC n=1 Tax=Candidatus Termititenax persephonae TaxID=2218525 RepID=A0A388TFZ3_9BACT|nr:rRNA methylase YqxC [Candidatus Termititenax persephonae]